MLRELASFKRFKLTSLGREEFKDIDFFIQPVHYEMENMGIPGRYACIFYYSHIRLGLDRQCRNQVLVDFLGSRGHYILNWLHCRYILAGQKQS